MYYVRAYVRMHLSVCVRRQSVVHLSVCRYECNHAAFGMRAGIRALVCLFARACVRASVRACSGLSVCLCLVHACIHLGIFKRP